MMMEEELHNRTLNQSKGTAEWIADGLHIEETKFVGPLHIKRHTVLA